MTTTWLPGPDNPQLGLNAVHVWQAALASPPELLAQYESLLAEDERDRAARFHFGRHRDRYITGRGILRTLLGRYLSQPPAALMISYSEYGKPTLPSGKIQFNLAHSGDLALFAFSLHEPLGVDVEAARKLSDALAIANRFFSPSEYNTLQSLPPDQQISAFFRCWTRKEAFIKAVGEGLSYPLDAFDVTLAPNEPARILSIRGAADAPQHWQLHSLQLPEGHYGALAIKGALNRPDNYFFYS